MTAPSDKTKRATYQDVLDAPEHMIAEIINGEMRLSPRPGAPHAKVASTLGGDLEPPFARGRGGPGGWIILDEPELHLGDQIVVPDLAGWRLERMPAIEDKAYFSLAPDWICEVLSRSNEATDRLDKLPIYAAAGVGYAWLVHPFRRSLEVFRLHEQKWLTLATFVGDQRVRAEPFDAIELDLSTWWRGLPPPATRASEEPLPYAFAFELLTGDQFEY